MLPFLPFLKINSFFRTIHQRPCRETPQPSLPGRVCLIKCSFLLSASSGSRLATRLNLFSGPPCPTFQLGIHHERQDLHRLFATRTYFCSVAKDQFGNPKERKRQRFNFHDNSSSHYTLPLHLHLPLLVHFCIVLSTLPGIAPLLAPSKALLPKGHRPALACFA